MIFDVYVYAVVRVKVPNVEADTPLEAIEKANELDLHEILTRPSLPGRAEYVTYDDANECYLVERWGEDRDGDPEYAEWFADAMNPTPPGKKITTCIACCERLVEVTPGRNLCAACSEGKNVQVD